MKYANEKWFDELAEQLVRSMRNNRIEDQKKYMIKQALKKAYAKGGQREIILKALEQVKL